MWYNTSEKKDIDCDTQEHAWLYLNWNDWEIWINFLTFVVPGNGLKIQRNSKFKVYKENEIDEWPINVSSLVLMYSIRDMTIIFLFEAYVDGNHQKNWLEFIKFDRLFY